MNSTCLLIPVYDHSGCLADVVDRVSTTGLPALLVNDGSAQRSTDIMRGLARQYDWVSLVEREENGGKGAAVKTGLAEAARLGYSHVLQLDADGQHNMNDIPRLLDLSALNPGAIVSGAPIFKDVPAIRFYGRYLTHVLVWIHTLSLDIEDSMCGFRVYPLASTLAIINNSRVGDRMDFDPEILVRLHWAGVPVVQFRTPVSYPMDGVSHFRGLADNALITWMHARLFLGMLWRLPQLLARRMHRHD